MAAVAVGTGGWSDDELAVVNVFVTILASDRRADKCQPEIPLPLDGAGVTLSARHRRMSSFERKLGLRVVELHLLPCFFAMTEFATLVGHDCLEFAAMWVVVTDQTLE